MPFKVALPLTIILNTRVKVLIIVLEIERIARERERESYATINTKI